MSSRPEHGTEGFYAYLFDPLSTDFHKDVLFGILGLPGCGEDVSRFSGSLKQLETLFFAEFDVV